MSSVKVFLLKYLHCSLETAKKGRGISFCINVYRLSAGGSNNTKETNWSLCQVLYHRW